MQFQTLLPSSPGAALELTQKKLFDLQLFSNIKVFLRNFSFFLEKAAELVDKNLVLLGGKKIDLQCCFLFLAAFRFHCRRGWVLVTGLFL